MNKKAILEKFSEYDIFCKYLNFSPKMGEKFLSPLRNDKNPTCNLFVNYSNSIIMKDHSGHFVGNCFDFVMRLYNVDFAKALQIINDDLSLTPVASSFIKPKSRSKKITFTLKKDYGDFWKRYHISKELLEYYRTHTLDKVWVDDYLVYEHSLNNPGYVHYFKKDDFKLYFPFRYKGKFINNSRMLQGLDQLPEKGERLCITKSIKDVMVLYNLSLPSVCQPSETILLKEEDFEKLSTRFTRIYSLYDFDLTGVRTANRLKKKYGITPVFLTNGRFGSIDYGAKDISDVVKNMKKEKTSMWDLKEWIDNTFI